MARNDIRFAQANQADFGQANALYLQSMQALNNAVTGLQDTAKTFGDAVTKKNTATAKDMINQLSLDDWNNPEKRQQLHQDLQAFNDRMGNAVHFDEIVKHKQDNHQRLLQDSNAYYQNKQNQAITVKDDLARQELERNHRVMETFGQVYDIDNQLSNLTKDDPKRQELISQKDTLLSSLTGLDRQNYDRNSLLWKTEQNKANYDYNQSNLLSVQDEIKFNAGLLALKQYKLSQATDETKKQLVNQDIQELNTKIANLSMSTGNPYGGLNYSDEQQSTYHNTNIQPKIDGAIKAQQALAKAIAEKQKSDRDFALNVSKHNETVRNNTAQNSIAQQNADTRQVEVQAGIEKTAVDTALKMQEQQNKTQSAQKEQDKQYAKFLGNNWRNSDNSLNGASINNHLQNLIDTFNQRKKNFATDVSEDKYQAQLKTIKANAPKEKWYSGDFDDVVKLVASQEFAKELGRPLTRGEQLAVLYEFTQLKDIPYTTSGKKSYLNMFAKNLVTKQNLSLESQQFALVDNSLKALNNLGYSYPAIIGAIQLNHNHTLYPYLSLDMKKIVHSIYGEPSKKGNQIKNTLLKGFQSPTNNTTGTKNGTPTGEYILSNWQ